MVKSPPLDGVDADVRVPAVRARRARAIVRLCRPEQWIKNGLVLAGLFFSDQLFERRVALQSVRATIGFCLLSSAIYCLNDIIDRDADAAHPEKRQRPLASGTLTVTDAWITGAVLLAGAAALLLTGLNWQVPTIAGAYLVMNALYSQWLKHVALVDVLIIAAGFVLRLVAGTYAVEVEPTSWIVLTTGLGALLLALGKRRGDLEQETASHRASLAGYTLAFIDQALAMMAAATVVVYALYTVSDYAQARFDAPLLYLTTFPVVAGILRYLQTVMVYGRYGSPTDLALHDRPLQLVVAIWLAMFALFVYA